MSISIYFGPTQPRDYFAIKGIMWKVITNGRFNLIHRRLFELDLQKFFTRKRLFLSEAYQCQEAWEKRLQAPILQNIKLDEMYQQLDSKFQKLGKASAIDIDLFANVVREESYLDELEDLLHKLRLSPNTSDMLPSTSHTVIRHFLAVGKHHELLRILDDRINYGIFPDDFCSCLLMDTFLKEKNYAGAARVGILQMLQEDWSHPITAHLALYSCHMYLKNPEPWEDPTQTEEPDDGEEIKVRVKYLRNPYFDDHFDLRDPKLLIGKTLATLGATFFDAVGRTYQLVGWGLYQKWDKAVMVLETLLKEQQKPAVFREGIEMFKEVLKELPHEDENSKELNVKFSHLIKELDTLGLITENDLHDAVIEKVKMAVNANEKELIEEQCKTYTDWEILREKLLQEQLHELRKQERLAKVQEEKENLAKREEVIFFFDNEEKLELGIEEKKKKYFRKRYFGKRKPPRAKDEHYIPPDVKQI